jgi:sulfite dehydrogenase
MIDRTRRKLLAAGALASAGLGTFRRSAFSRAADTLDMPFENGTRKLVAYPGKRPLIVLTSRPPQLETPFRVFNEGLITPNDAFFVRYHHAGIPATIDGDRHVIEIGGNAVNKPFRLSMADLRRRFESIELVAVNQCSGNSRGFFNPRVTGGQLGNGAMGNARWVGAPLKSILAEAGLKSSARQVTFNGLDMPLFGAADFVEALDVEHAMDGEVLLAYRMNGADIPLLNGYPVKLIVPGYYGTYWVKHVSKIEVIDSVFDGFWMKTAYRIPDNECACVAPGTTPSATRPIGCFNVRSFITPLQNGAKVHAGRQTVGRGIAFDGGREFAKWRSLQMAAEPGSRRDWAKTLDAIRSVNSRSAAYCRRASTTCGCAHGITRAKLSRCNRFGNLLATCAMSSNR